MPQQVHYPCDPLQLGPMYFLRPRKCDVFGVCFSKFSHNMSIIFLLMKRVIQERRQISLLPSYITSLKYIVYETKQEFCPKYLNDIVAPLSSIPEPGYSASPSTKRNQWM